MPRLSIIIAHSSRAQQLEATLVSVLQNRPDDCEVIVVHRGDYDDPYELADEVRYLEVAAHSKEVDCLNTGIWSARSPLIHILASGVEVESGWTDAAIAEFDDPNVGLVSPLVVNADARDEILTAGLQTGLGGRRVVCGAGMKLDHEKARRLQPVGPSLLAGFYRQSAVMRCGGFEARVGTTLSDLDLALSLNGIQLKCRLAVESRVHARKLPQESATALESGRNGERLVWRHAPHFGWAATMLSRPAVFAAELIGGALRPSAWGRLAGRLLAYVEFGKFRKHHLHLRQAAQAEPAKLRQDSGNRRIDTGHDASCESPKSGRLGEPANTARAAAAGRPTLP